MQRTFSPSEAALSIFGLAKRQPQFVLRFCIIYALVIIVTFALAGSLGVGKALQDVAILTAAGGQPSQEAIVEAITPATGGVTIMLVFTLVTSALLTGMGLRKAVFDADEGLFGLKVGGDEGRLFLSILLVGAILVGVNMAVSIIGALVTLGNVRLIGITVLATLVGMALVAVRLSQFGVMTIADRKIGVLASWRETKGQGLRFFGAHALWLIIALIGTGLVQAVGTLGAAALGNKIGGGLPASLEAFLTPGWLLYTLLSGMASGFANLGSLCIGAYAWHQMRGDIPAPATTLK
jgi:hypothetical protein